MSTTLPSKPKAFGNLRHVFKSSLAAVGLDVENPLGFQDANSVTVVLIDGLGTHQIQQRAGHSPWLAAAKGSGYSVFPSTTASGITSFATGLWPGEHGIIGHQAFDRQLNLGGNMLTGWGSGLVARDWQTQSPLSERAAVAGISVRVIAHSEYQTTGFTEITMRGAEFFAGESTSQRFDIALSKSGTGVNYLYIAELDKIAHRFGWQSRQWVEAYEQVALEAERFVSSRGDMAVVITADHGLVDTEPDRRIFLDQALGSFDLEFFGGDTRVAFLYLKHASREQLEDAVSSIGYALSVHTVDEVIAAGYMGPISRATQDRLPDFILMAKSNYTLFHSGFSKPKSSEMVAHHGGLTPAETQVPLLRFGL